MSFSPPCKKRPGRLTPRKIVCVILAIGFFACGGCKRAGNSWLDDSTGDPNVSRFVNSRTGLTGPLAEHYVDFSFNYPSSWARDRSQADPARQTLWPSRRKRLTTS